MHCILGAATKQYIFGFFLFVFFYRTNVVQGLDWRTTIHSRVPSASRGWVSESSGGVDICGGSGGGSGMARQCRWR